jgi:hypothetical protein
MDDLINYPVHVSFFEIKIGKEGDSLGNVIAFSCIYFRETFNGNYAFNLWDSHNHNHERNAQNHPVLKHGPRSATYM